MSIVLLMLGTWLVVAVISCILLVYGIKRRKSAFWGALCSRSLHGWCGLGWPSVRDVAFPELKSTWRAWADLRAGLVGRGTLSHRGDGDLASKKRSDLASEKRSRAALGCGEQAQDSDT